MVEDEWGIDPAMEPKLVLLKLLNEKGGETWFLDVADKGQRRMMIMIRGGTAPLRVGCRRTSIERRYGECDLERVKDVQH